MDKKLELIAFSPMADIGFWSTLAKKKLEEWKLNEDSQDIYVKYKANNFGGKKAFLSLDVYSFSFWELQLQGPVEIAVKAQLKNFNTIEGFQNLNFDLLLNELARNQLLKIDDFIENPQQQQLDSNVWQFVTYADLKKHKYSYKLCSPSIKVEGQVVSDKKPFKSTIQNQEELKHFDEGLKAFLKAGLIAPFFYFKRSEDGKYIFGSIREYLNELQSGNGSKVTSVFYDSYSQANGTSSVFSNLLALILRYALSKGLNSDILRNLQFLLLKDQLVYNYVGLNDFKNSIALTLDLASAKIIEKEYIGCDPKSMPTPIDLKSSLDEATLASEAVDLNIKLMKWRVLPSLDLELIKNTKVLMFGAGTLGCQLSRNLIGWGVKHISFIDYGTVSYSNPVRQTLYDFEDSINGGKPKAECAAARLKKIFPDLQSQGYQIKIPMPGHYLADEQHALNTLKDVDQIEELVKSHDVLYLMTDSRESRWLPTILANKYNKVISRVCKKGLGFDSFVIVRHGLSPYVHKDEINGERLSCYFCNDVVSPGNTMKDRSLDQQCTVTRPGLSFVSSAYASELLISLLHHPLKNGAPADEDSTKLPETDLGILPQHIRGTMGEFETRLLYGKAFEHCVACSQFVLDEYNNNRDVFLQKVINNPDYLQAVTHLDEMMRDLDSADACVEID